MERTTTTIADRYVLGSLIATGGMAEVYRARDEVLARTVAVKVLLSHLSEDPDLVARFRREALAAARLTHPNIISIYDTGTDGNEGDLRHYIVMEYCPGGTLSSALKERGSFDPDEVASIGATICGALGYAHAEKVIHRDIKPGNVLIVEHGTLKVTDFGIAKAAFSSGDLTTTGSIIGTVTYISPEQAQGEEPDGRSDLYSLGVLLYELATGRAPFRGETDVATALSHVREQPPSPRSVRAGIPRSLEDTILKALAKDPADRFASAEEMKHALDVSGGVGPQTLGIPRPSTPRPDPEDETGPMPFIKTEGKRNVPVVLLVIGAIVAATVIAALVGSQTEEPQSRNGGEGGGGAEVRNIEVTTAEDFDPHTGDGEHPELVADAHDGDPSTSWRTSTYRSSLQAQKPGVGIYFDLGREVDVRRVTVDFDQAGYALELRAANSIGDDEGSFDLIDEIGSSEAEQVFEANESYRYWLVWLTGFPGGGGGRATITEVSFDGI